MNHETRYALSDEVNIAYQITGSGTCDLVWAPGTVSHLEMDWELPAKARFIEGLSSFCRLIRFDKRGTGMSDRPTDAETIEERIDDIRAVMDAVGSPRASILGLSEGVNMACVFAATYPERTRSLLLWGGQAKWIKQKDYPWGRTREEIKQDVNYARRTWPSREYFQRWGAGAGTEIDEVSLGRLMKYGQAAVSPGAMAALEAMNMDIDTRHVLPVIQAPTLVMNRTGDPLADVNAARDLAAHIPGARFVELPGNTHSMTGEDSDRVLAIMEEFLTGTSKHTDSGVDRVLATIMFTDIVDSTQQASRLGDRRWTELLTEHNNVAARLVSRYGGRIVKGTGDGILATFDGPARAVRCALGFQDELRSLGIEIRAGLHVGEIERMGNDVGGIAVHLTARVSAKAGAGEVLVSRTVGDLLAGAGFYLSDRGLHSLKGIDGQWQLFNVERGEVPNQIKK